MRLIFELSLLSLTSIFAASGVAAELDSTVPNASFFVGLGVSGSSVNFEDQHVTAGGTTWQPGPVLGWGTGSTAFSLDSSAATVPMIQAGYMKHFSNSRWIWGGKIDYTYLNISAEHNLLIPQLGGVTSTSNGVTTPYSFSGNYTVQTYRQTLNHQISLAPLIGRSFEKSSWYLGIGPTFAQTKTSIYNMASPIAFVNGLPESPTGVGNGSNYSTNQWLFGGVAMIGATYFISPTWFLDLNYRYARTGTITSRFAGPWTDTLPSGSTRIGYNSGLSSGSVTPQAVSASINIVF